MKAKRQTVKLLDKILRKARKRAVSREREKTARLIESGEFHSEGQFYVEHIVKYLRGELPLLMPRAFQVEVGEIPNDPNRT